MKKQFKVILLPNNSGWKKGDVIKWISNGKLFIAPDDNPVHSLGKGQIEAQHMNLIDPNEDINVHDWYVIYDVSGNPMVYQCRRIEEDRVYYGSITSDAKKQCQKVVASTDKSLNLPQIAPKDIQWWIEAGCPDSVEIQMESYRHYNDPDIRKANFEYRKRARVVNEYIQIVKSFRNPTSINEDLIKAGIDIPRWTTSDMYDIAKAAYEAAYTHQNFTADEWLLHNKSQNHV